MAFTDAKLTALKVKNQRYEIFEGRGFGIRVTPKGTKTFILLYRHAGKVRRLTLGEFDPEHSNGEDRLTLADAHEAAAKARTRIKKGEDVAHAEKSKRDEIRRAPTVSEFAGEYLIRWASRKAAASEREDTRMLEKDVKPTIGHLKMQDVRRRDVIALLDTIADRNAPIAANRTAALLSRLFNFAIERGVIDASPCVRLPIQKETPRKRALSDDEILQFWNGLPAAEASEGVRLALKLVLVTGQRPGEITGMRLDEIQGTWWTIPVERIKTRHKDPSDHRVPLSKVAIELVETAKENAGGSAYLFPSPRKEEDRPIDEKSLSRALRRNYEALDIVEPFTPHDLRRTFRTKLSEIGTAPHIAEQVLNHTVKGMTKVYDQHGFEKEKRRAMDQWERRLKAILEGKKDRKVVSLGGGNAK